MRNETPFYWQDRCKNSAIRAEYKGPERAKMLALYSAICELEARQINPSVNRDLKLICFYSGLDRDFVEKGVEELARIRVISYGIRRKVVYSGK